MELVLNLDRENGDWMHQMIQTRFDGKHDVAWVNTAVVDVCKLPSGYFRARIGAVDHYCQLSNGTPCWMSAREWWDTVHLDGGTYLPRRRHHRVRG